MKRTLILSLFILTTLLLTSLQPVFAQADTPVVGEISISTTYPSQIIAIGEDATFSLKLSTNNGSDVVRLSMKELPEGWEAIFRGGGKIIQSAFLESSVPTTVELRLTPPDEQEGGTFEFIVEATDGSRSTEFPLELTVKDKVPASLSFDVDLPRLKGTPKTIFRYNATLRNDGDEELVVNLLSEAPNNFLVVFKTGGQEVTNIPLAAGESKSINIEAQTFPDTPSGEYDFDIKAQGGSVVSALTLTAELTGQPEVQLSTLEGILSGKAYAGKETPIQLIITNTGTAPARQIELSASPPANWLVEFEPKTIDELAAGQQMELTVNVKPAEKAIAGDYMLTLRASGNDGISESVDFRITVNTSTLWGVVGIALIAVAVGVVALAVLRFGRR